MQNAGNAHVLHITPAPAGHIARQQWVGVGGGGIRLVGAPCAPLEADTEQPRVLNVGALKPLGDDVLFTSEA